MEKQAYKLYCCVCCRLLSSPSSLVLALDGDDDGGLMDPKVLTPPASFETHKRDETHQNDKHINHKEDDNTTKYADIIHCFI